MKSQSGQAVIEYVLILVVGVAMAALITRALVSRNAENPGIITGQWYRMNQVVAEDLPDRLDN